MRRLIDILWGWDPAPIGWRGNVRLGLVLFMIEGVAILVLIQIINAIA